jgi:hypothetical protein
VENGIVRTRAADARPALLRKILVHAFVLFHLFAMAAWSFTSPVSLDPLHKALRSRLGPYVIGLGLTQAWTMFAPNPPMDNAYVEAEVTFSDGSQTAWPFSQLQRPGFLQGHHRERLYKWSAQRLWSGKTNVVLARAAAQFVARQVERRPDNPPRRVELIRYTKPIPPPSKRWLTRRPVDSRPWDRNLFFACELDDTGAVAKISYTGERPATTGPAEAGPATDPGEVPPDGGAPAGPQKGKAQ